MIEFKGVLSSWAILLKKIALNLFEVFSSFFSYDISCMQISFFEILSCIFDTLISRCYPKDLFLKRYSLLQSKWWDIPFPNKKKLRSEDFACIKLSFSKVFSLFFTIFDSWVLEGLLTLFCLKFFILSIISVWSYVLNTFSASLLKNSIS